MKNSMLILSFLLTSTLFSSELSWVDEQVQAIKPAREGMLQSSLRSIKSPFIFLAKNRGKSEKSKKSSSSNKKTFNSNKLTEVTSTKKRTADTIFTLSLIMNNSAMINGLWYRTGNTIDGYKIIKIDRNSVLLTKRKKRIFLSTKSQSTQLHFKK